MLLASLDAETKKEIVETVGEVLSGTPDATRAEPFTWVMLFGIAVLIIAILAIICTFCWQLVMRLIVFINGVNVAQQTMAAECHKASRENLIIATDAAAKCESALMAQADASDRNTDVMERVILKLGTP